MANAIPKITKMKEEALDGEITMNDLVDTLFTLKRQVKTEG